MKNAGKQTGDRARMNRQMATEIQRQRERQQNNDMMTESVVLMSLWPRTVNILISNWSRKRKFSQWFKNTSREDRGFSLFSPLDHAFITLYDRPVFMLWLVKILQVNSCRKFIQHLETCLLWQLKLTEFFVILWYLLSFSTGCAINLNKNSCSYRLHHRAFHILLRCGLQFQPSFHIACT